MPLSLTCTCGAKLEIDDKFAGQVITCPDCQKDLSTAPEPIRAARTSGFALASLILALIGPFTLIAPLSAVICGLIGLGHIKRFPQEVGGPRFAWAGIILGAMCVTLSLLGYFSPEVLRVDGIFREIEWSGKLQFPDSALIESESGDSKFSITRPRPGWGKIAHRLGNFHTADDLILIDAWNDAQLTCLHVDYRFEGEERDVVLERALKRFLDSELVNSLSRPGIKVKCEEGKKETIEPAEQGSTTYEMLINFNAGGPPRTFLLRVIKIDGNTLYIAAAGTRTSRFHRLEPELRQLLGSYHIEP